jgi:hypothetical protein
VIGFRRIHRSPRAEAQRRPAKPRLLAARERGRVDSDGRTSLRVDFATRLLTVERSADIIARFAVCGAETPPALCQLPIAWRTVLDRCIGTLEPGRRTERPVPAVPA